MQTVPDETMIVPGFEHHILNCPCCHDEERQLVFIRQPAPLSPPTETFDGSYEPSLDFLACNTAARWFWGKMAATEAAPSRVPADIIQKETLSIESVPLPSASPAYQPSISRSARAANSSAKNSKAAPASSALESVM